jgi:CubicO group peptidase (beta-lactamase class C family)
MDASIADLAKEAMAVWNITGMAVGVIKNYEVVFSGGFGQADVLANTSVTDRTLFQIASNSKAFTSMLLLELAAKQLLNLDRPVREFLPAFKLASDDTIGEQVDRLTLRDLMSHRTGLPRHDFEGFTSPTRSEVISRLQYQAFDKPARYAPGEYNNNMFVSAGVAAEAVTGQTWEQLVDELIFAPLGMTRTFANLSSVPDSEQPFLSKPYSQHRQVPYMSADVSAPAGAIVSNVADLLKWVALHLRQSAPLFSKQAPPGAMLLNTTGYINLVQGITPFPMYTMFDQYTLGWWLVALSSHDTTQPLFVHGGNLNGFSSNIGFLPSLGHAIVVLTNEDSSLGRDALLLSLADYLTNTSRSPTYNDAFRAVLNREVAAEKLETQALQDKISRTPGPGRVPSLPLSTYCGIYDGSPLGLASMEIQVAGASIQLCGALLANLTAPSARSCQSLSHMWYDTFALADEVASIRASSLTVQFVTDGYGGLSGMTVPIERAVPSAFFPKSASVQ